MIPVNGNRAELLARFEMEALPHHKGLYQTAACLLSDRSRATDAVQEVYLIAWRKFDVYQSGTNCRAWLFQILANVIRHEQRRWFKWVVGKDADIAELPREAPPLIPDRLTDPEILKALRAVPEPFRRVLLLVDVEEFSYKEASEILGVPIGTIMSRLSRGRAALRRELASTLQ